MTPPARTPDQVLADAASGTLHVEGLGVADDADVLLLEDAGRPLFFCPDDCALARAAARRGRATLRVPGGWFCGRLRAVAAEQVGAEVVQRVTLDVESYCPGR